MQPYDKTAQTSTLDTTAARMLDPDSMQPLQVEREIVPAAEVFHDEQVLTILQEHRKTILHYEQNNDPPASVAAINALSVPDGYVPQELSSQDVAGKNIADQAELVLRADFVQAVAHHPDFRGLGLFAKPMRMVLDTGALFNLLLKIGNLWRGHKIKVLRGSSAEMGFVDFCYGNAWPPGVNLYTILRELYPVFHALSTGQVPIWLAENMDDLLDGAGSPGSGGLLRRLMVDGNNRFMSLLPVAEVPGEHVTGDALFVSQDQLGRRAIVARMLDDVSALMNESRQRKVLVIDYAGGNGNMSELLLRRIYALPDAELRTCLLHNLRVVVIDVSEGQLAGGRIRFAHINRTPGFEDIMDKIIFLKGDATRPFQEEECAQINRAFGPDFVTRAVSLGMTSYTIGALDNMHREDGVRFPEAMAESMFSQCWKIYVTDFSSPMWRMNAFLQDTGSWGKEYLRVLHGVAEEHEEHMPFPGRFAIALKVRYGLNFKSIADFVRYTAMGPALAANYMTVWPGSDGHSSGYTVLEDNTLKKPAILSYGRRLQGLGADVLYKSRVNLFATGDLGGTTKGNRAWYFMPGWVADFIVASNEHNRPEN